MVVADHIRSEMNHCRQQQAACRFFKPGNLMERDDQYIKLVCDYLKLPVEEVISKKRKHELCEARQVISYILTIHTKLSLSKIGSVALPEAANSSGRFKLVPKARNPQ